MRRRSIRNIKPDYKWRSFIPRSNPYVGAQIPNLSYDGSLFINTTQDTGTLGGYMAEFVPGHKDLWQIRPYTSTQETFYLRTDSSNGYPKKVTKIALPTIKSQYKDVIAVISDNWPQQGSDNFDICNVALGTSYTVNRPSQIPSSGFEIKDIKFSNNTKLWVLYSGTGSSTAIDSYIVLYTVFNNSSPYIGRIFTIPHRLRTLAVAYNANYPLSNPTELYVAGNDDGTDRLGILYKLNYNYTYTQITVPSNLVMETFRGMEVSKDGAQLYFLIPSHGIMGPSIWSKSYDTDEFIQRDIQVPKIQSRYWYPIEKWAYAPEVDKFLLMYLDILISRESFWIYDMKLDKLEKEFDTTIFYSNDYNQWWYEPPESYGVYFFCVSCDLSHIAFSLYSNIHEKFNQIGSKLFAKTTGPDYIQMKIASGESGGIWEGGLPYPA